MTDTVQLNKRKLIGGLLVAAAMATAYVAAMAISVYLAVGNWLDVLVVLIAFVGGVVPFGFGGGYLLDRWFGDIWEIRPGLSDTPPPKPPEETPNG